MRKILIALLLTALFVMPVSAAEITAPTVPDSGKIYMPRDTDNLLEGILEILRTALLNLRPDLREASKTCLGVIAAVMIVSVVRTLPGTTQKVCDLSGTVAVAGILLSSANTMVNLASQTIQEISEYGKLLLPVMTTAMAAQGCVTSSTALYTVTAIFDTVLSAAISNILTPMIYIFLALAAANSAVGEEMLKKIRDMVKGFLTWVLKTLLYIFTGFIGITGVVSGSTDAAALKAAKLTISGVVPVVGGILSDASEAVLVGAGTVKNAAGLYGLFAILALWIGPFIKIGSHYLLLKATGAVCAVFGGKQTTDLIGDFSSAMGLLLGMTGAVCLMLMISTVCFMKGVG